jgi:hypothetical protein
MSHPVDGVIAARNVARLFGTKTMGFGMPKRLHQWARRAHELDLIGTGSLTGEQNLWFEQAQRMFTGQGRYAGAAARIPAPIRKAVKAPLELMKRTYTSFDDAAKAFAWELNTQRLKRLIKTDADRVFVRDELSPSLFERRGYGSIDPEVVAAELAKDTVQHFPRTMPLGRKLSKNPLVGTFPSFALEMPRNLKNSLVLGAKEIKHGIATARPDWVASGTSRLAGVFSVTYFMGKMVPDWSARTLGFTKEKFQSLKRLLSFEWNENSEWVVVDRDREKGTTSYYDVGNSNPYTQTNKLWLAALETEGSLADKALAVAEQLEETYLGREIFLGAALEFMVNKRVDSGLVSTMIKLSQGKTGFVYNPGSEERYAEAAYRFFKQTAPGGLISAERVGQAAGMGRGFGLAPDLPPETAAKRTYELAAEILAVFGAPRLVTVKDADRFASKAAPMAEFYRENRRAYQNEFKAAPSPKEKLEKKEAYSKRWDSMQDDILQLVRDARAADIPDKTIRERLKGKYRAEIVDAFILGRKVDFEVAFPDPEGVARVIIR